MAKFDFTGGASSGAKFDFTGGSKKPFSWVADPNAINPQQFQSIPAHSSQRQPSLATAWIKGTLGSLVGRAITPLAEKITGREIDISKLPESNTLGQKALGLVGNLGADLPLWIAGDAALAKPLSMLAKTKPIAKGINFLPKAITPALGTGVRAGATYAGPINVAETAMAGDGVEGFTNRLKDVPLMALGGSVLHGGGQLLGKGVKTAFKPRPVEDFSSPLNTRIQRTAPGQEWTPPAQTRPFQRSTELGPLQLNRNNFRARQAELTDTFNNAPVGSVDTPMTRSTLQGSIDRRLGVGKPTEGYQGLDAFGKPLKSYNLKETIKPNQITKTKEITIPFRKNTEKAPKFTTDEFAQSIEPKGDYINYHDPSLGTNLPNYEYGNITFKNPLVIEYVSTGHGGWKTKLSEKYGGKKGKALTNAVKKDGYDGIITMDKGKEVREIVSIDGKKSNIGFPSSGKTEGEFLNALSNDGAKKTLSGPQFKLKPRELTPKPEPLPIAQPQRMTLSGNLPIDARRPIRQLTPINRQPIVANEAAVAPIATPRQPLSSVEMSPQIKQLYRDHRFETGQGNFAKAQKIERAIKEYATTGGTPIPQANKVNIGEPKPVNERRFAQNVRDSRVAPEAVKQNTLENPLTYEPITNKETLNKANIEVATDAVKARQKFNAPSKGISADDVALGESLIVKAIKDGDTVGANELIADLAEKLTTAGQAVQAASIFKRLTPEGMLLYAQRTVNTVNKNLIERLGKKAPKVELTPEDSKFIIDTMTRVQKLADGREKDIAMAQVKKLISEKMPASLASKVAALQRISLLLNPKTMNRNILGNTVFGAIDNVANVVATPIDMLASKVFKTPRTTTLPSIPGQLKSMAQGVKLTAQDAKLGIDTYNTKTQYEFSGTRNFNNKILHKLDRATIVGLKMGDTPFHKAAFDDSLRQQMKLAKVDKPTVEMEIQAQKAGDQRTYQDVNDLTEAFKMVQKSLNKISSAVHLGSKEFGLGNLVMPFVKTPANILMRALEYSPAGISTAIKEATKLRNGKFDQKAFVDSISRSATGTALIMVGYDLAKRGMITGSGNKDKDVAAFERGLGKNDYAYKYGDNLYTYDWMQPGSMAIAIGADVYIKGKDRKQAENVVIDAAKSGGETLFKQSLLQGVTRFMSGYNPMDSIAKTVINSPTQFIPTVAKQISQTQDPTQRTTYSPNMLGTAGNMLKGRIPGMTKSLEQKINTSGETQQTFQGRNTLGNIFLNPGSATKYKPNEVQRGILDLYDKTGDVTIFPRVAPKSITYKGESIKLSPKEMTSYQQTLGRITETRMKPILADKKTDNAKKVEELQNAIKMANEDAKAELLRSRGIEYKK